MAFFGGGARLTGKFTDQVEQQLNAALNTLSAYDKKYTEGQVFTYAKGAQTQASEAINKYVLSQPDVSKAYTQVTNEVTLARTSFEQFFDGWAAWEIALVSIVTYLILSHVLTELYEFLFTYPGPLKKSWNFIMRNYKRLPGVTGLVQAQIMKSKKGLWKDMLPHRDDLAGYYFPMLPVKGFAHDKKKLMAIVEQRRGMQKVDWTKGHVSGTVYHAGDDLTEVLVDVYKAFAWSNPLHPDVFPGVRQMESEAVSMVADMFKGGSDCVGTMTSGGTESLVMAVKTYRDRAKAERGVTKPELLMCLTAHAGFNKACEYFNVKCVSVPADRNGRIDLSAVRRYINKNTIAVVGSAPSFPHGILDDIDSLSKIIKAYGPKGCGLHVDSCLGGFIVPFMEEAGFGSDLESGFDFRVPGVTSISVDTHKYGYSPKGSSILLWRDQSWRRYQYFVYADWTGGTYASPSMPGSRPGAIVASTWGALMYFGREGYVEATRKCVTARKKIESGLRAMEKRLDGQVFVYGKPATTVIGIGTKGFSPFQLSEQMGKRGWNMNNLQNPSSIHLCVTHVHTPVGIAEKFLDDLEQAVDYLVQNPSDVGEAAALYGMATAVPDKSIIDEIASAYIDGLYLCKTAEDFGENKKNGQSTH
eukprot:Clim_evm32s195 gene=Clim_evmTU32s195